MHPSTALRTIAPEYSFKGQLHPSTALRDSLFIAFAEIPMTSSVHLALSIIGRIYAAVKLCNYRQILRKPKRRTKAQTQAKT